MKFKIKFLIFLCLLIAGIAGCSAAKKDENAHPDKGGIPTDCTTYDFSTTDELAEFLVGEDGKSIAMEEAELYGSQYAEFTKKIASKDYLIKIPYISGQKMEFRNREGYSNIILLTKDFLSRPWI